jgi:hypothetical protein
VLWRNDLFILHLISDHSGYHIFGSYDKSFAS